MKYNLIKKFAICIIFILVVLNIVQYRFLKKYGDQIQNDKGYSLIYRYLPSLTPSSFQNKLTNRDDFVVYIGSPECPDCISFENTLLSIIDKSNFNKEIYFLNLYWLRKEYMEEYKNLKKKLEYEQIPNFILFENGRVISKIEWSEKGLKESEVIKWMKTNKIIN